MGKKLNQFFCPVLCLQWMERPWETSAKLSNNNLKNVIDLPSVFFLFSFCELLILAATLVSVEGELMKHLLEEKLICLHARPACCFALWCKIKDQPLHSWAIFTLIWTVLIVHDLFHGFRAGVSKKMFTLRFPIEKWEF